MRNFKHNFLGILFIFIISFSIVNHANASDVYYNYAKNMGGSGSDYGNIIIRDSSGNQYVTGGFSGNADFDPGSGTTELTSAGGTDIFIQKLNSSGDLVWAKRIGNTGSQEAGAIAVDSSGNVYIVGGFTNTIDFDPGSGTNELTALSSTAGAGDIYILKLNSSGEFVWVKQIGGAGNNAQGWVGNDWATKIVIDSSDNMFVVGSFGYTVDFDPGAGTANLSVYGGSGADIFMLKLNSAGEYVWAKSMGCVDWGDYANDIALDSSGNIYLTGIFGGSLAGRTADFDPGAGTANLTNIGPLDIYVAKYNSLGEYVWAKNIGGSGLSEWRGGYGISVDSSGNVYTVGGLNGALDFDPGAGTNTLTSAGSYDAYLLKLDSSGEFVSVKQFGSTGDDFIEEIKIDSSNYMYVAGNFDGSFDFDLGVGTATLTSAGGGCDAYLQKFDSSGDFVYIKQFGGTGCENVRGLAIDSTGTNVWMTGYFNNTVDFDPSPNTFNVTSNGGNDMFVIKLGPDTTTPTATSISSSNVTNITATISWTTSEVSSSIVEYGTTTSYGSTTTEADTGSSGVTTHSVTLSGLSACTTYHFRVKSNDPSANLVTSSDNTFNTANCASAPVFILQAMSSAIRGEQVTNTNQSSNSASNSSTNSNLTPTKFIFTRNLKLGMRDTQVIELQKFLNNHNFLISTTGPGSLNNETNYFGLATKASLIKFQKANGIKPAVGYFGAVTRSFVNELVK